MTKNNEKKTKLGKRILYSLTALALLLGLVFSLYPGVQVSAEGRTSSQGVYSTEAVDYTNGSVERAGKINYNLPSVTNKSVYAYTRTSAVVGGVSLGNEALHINGIYYLPVRASFNALGAHVSYNSSTRTVTVTMSGLVLTATDGAYVVYANDRPLFNFSPAVVMSNGRMYIPASTLAKAVGLSMSTEDGVSLKGSVKPLAHASKFYREDEVLWLARIIMAEAGGESLLGQIAVGDVILNRVKSDLFPNTIWSVIFDRKYGVQFSPVANGTIYNTPSFTATLAAKICLEGVSLSDNAMYFLNPVLAHSNWIVNNRTYAYTIGNHDFYL